MIQTRAILARKIGSKNTCNFVEDHKWLSLMVEEKRNMAWYDLKTNGLLYTYSCYLSSTCFNSTKIKMLLESYSFLSNYKQYFFRPNERGVLRRLNHSSPEWPISIFWTLDPPTAIHGPVLKSSRVIKILIREGWFITFGWSHSSSAANLNRDTEICISEENRFNDFKSLRKTS